MRSPASSLYTSLISLPDARSSIVSRRKVLFLASALLAVAVSASPALSAQSANRTVPLIDTSQLQSLPNQRPQWAIPASSFASLPADLSLDQMTLVLSRSPEQETAFEQLLADQQNPASPDYHHWLTPAEVGERFGLSDQDVATIAGWLQSQGLHVNWVAPSRIFIRFGGTAADIGRAFHTELHYYNVDGKQLMSVSSDPMIPQALAPAVKAIRGLYTIDEEPQYRAGSMQSASPEMNSSNGNHYLAPADFASIYDLPSSLTGAGQTIGIVDRSRTDFADFANFRSLTGSTFANPTEIVPTALGGVDPGPAYTSPPGGSISINDQGEATLDVLRAGSVAPGANLLLVVATSASGGIDTDAEYLVQTTPVPAQVMTISYLACESSAGAPGVAFWNTLFQQAAAEGISVFVSSGDSGAAGCDTHSSAPPANPLPNSPNYICSSSYATCVGGTEFNDTGSPSQYWSSSNGVGLKSALGYIPEGAWNESTTSNVAATGGGVSSVIATPSWQTGTGVPSPRVGRYTPDIAFSSSGHDGYFACFAAAGNGCVVSGGSYTFEYFYGTSAAAPDMAGITALLNQQLGAAQGNLNPKIYSMAAVVPAAFHDVTVATSGVAGCSVNTASLCNNSITLLSGSGAQPGYLVGAGYDEATGLGSLDVNVFLNNYASAQLLPTPTTGTASSITAISATLAGVVNPNGADTHVWFLYGTSSTLSGAAQTPSQDLGSGTTASSASANISGLTPGATYYFQVVAQNSTGTSYGAIVSFVTNSLAKTTPNIVWSTPAAITYGVALSATQLDATASVAGTFVYSPAVGTVLAAGSQLLSVTFTPTDTTDYNTATASVTLTVNKATVSITASSPTVNYGSPVPAITPIFGTFLNGDTSAVLTTQPTCATTYTTTSAVGSSPSTSCSGAAAANYTFTYVNGVVTVNPDPTFVISGSSSSLTLTPGATTGNTVPITIAPANGFTGTVSLTCSITPAAASDPPTCSLSPNSVTITGAASQTATLTIQTTAQSSSNEYRKLLWPSAGTALALVLTFGIPRRRVSWLVVLCLLALSIAIGAVGCGGSSGGGSSANPGTSPGTYTITVTGTSGTTTGTVGTITLTVP